MREKGGRKENELGFGDLITGRGFCPREERGWPSDVDPSRSTARAVGGHTGQNEPRQVMAMGWNGGLVVS